MLLIMNEYCLNIGKRINREGGEVTNCIISKREMGRAIGE